MSRAITTVWAIALGLLASSCNQKAPEPKPETSEVRPTPPPAPEQLPSSSSVAQAPQPRLVVKPDPTPSTPPAPKPDVVPPKPKPEPPKPTPGPVAGPSDKLVTVDLSSYGVRAVINLPEGYQAKKDGSSLTITAGPSFKIEIDPESDSIDKAKEDLRKQADTKFLAEPPGGYFVVKGNDEIFADYVVRQDVMTGDKRFRATARIYGQKVRPRADQLWACISTFHQTDAQRKVEGPRKAAMAKLAELQISIYESSPGETIARLDTANTTDAAVALLGDIPDLTDVSISGTNKLTSKGMIALATLSQVHRLSLEGVWLNDAMFAPLKPMPSLRSLRLENTKVSEVGLASLAGMPNLTTFTFIRNRKPLTDAGAKHLATLTKLTTLHLPNNLIGDAGMASLAGMTELQDLDLERTRVTDAGLVHLAGKSKLRTVKLTGTPVHGAGLTHLKAATGLNTLDLSGSDVTDDGLVGVRGLTVASLLLKYTIVGDAGMAHLAAVNGLENLSLRSTRVTDAGVKHLGGAVSLQSLDLSYTDVTGATIGDLRACKKLYYLYLEGTALTDAAIPVLATMSPSLVNVIDTPVTDAGLKALESRPADQVLRVVHDYWQFSAPAVKAVVDSRPKITFNDSAPADPGPKELKPPTPAADLPKPDPDALFKRLDVKPDIDDEPAKPVIGVTLSGDKLTDRDLADLRGLKTLKRLEISGEKVTDEGLAHLAKLPALESLTLKCKNVTDAGLSYLAGLTSLRTLNLDGCGVTGDGLVYLKGLKNLTHLELPRFVYLPRHLAPLAELKSLAEIDLGSAITRNSLHAAQLYTVLPKVKSLTITKSNNRFLAALRSATSLEQLSIELQDNLAYSPRGLAGVGRLKNLRQLYIYGSVSDRAIAELANLTGLETLRIMSEWITDAGVVHLEKLSKLSYLDLSRSRVTDAVMASVAKLPELRELRLNGTQVTDACIPALVKLKDLRAVEIYGTLVTPEGVKKLKEACPDLSVYYPKDDEKE